MLAAQFCAAIPPATPAQAALTTNPHPAIGSVVPCLLPGTNGVRLASACFASAWDQTSYGSAPNPANGDAAADASALLSFGDTTPDGSADLGDAPGNGHRRLATVGDTGAVYGLAYASGANPAAPNSGERLYSGAFTKRITRFGPGGPGAIYVTDLGSGATRLLAQIPHVVPGPNGFPGDPGDGSQATFPNQSYGIGAYTPQLGGLHRTRGEDQIVSYVGLTGLGDLELDPQERFLYATNLRDRQIYRVDTWAADPQTSVTALPAWPGLTSPSACGGYPQDTALFALLVTERYVYVGGTCTARTGRDRNALAVGTVRYDLLGGTWQGVFGFGLAAFDGQREPSSGRTDRETDWLPWGDYRYTNYSQAPLLTGMTVAEDGSMLLGVRNILADAAPSQRIPADVIYGMGDLLRAPPNASGGWDPPAASSEYFSDNATTDAAPHTHPETSWGAVAYVPGAHGGGPGGEVVNTGITPYRNFTGGVRWYPLSGGTPVASEELYADSAERLGKTGGLGDLELLCAWRAVGDRVWRDTNANGVQDPGEPNIDGVRLNLLDASGTQIATATTSSLGGESNYKFYVKPFQSYRVQVDPQMFQPGQPLAGLGLTNAGVGDPNRDSDADLTGVVSVAAGNSGTTDLSYDIGVALRAEISVDKTGTTMAPPGGSVSYTLDYRNSGPSAATDMTLIDTLPDGMAYVSASPPPSSVSGQTLRWDLGTLAVGSGQISVRASIAADVAAETRLVNQVSISTSTPGDDPNNNRASTTTVVKAPDLRIDKSGPLTVTAGEQLTYQISYANAGGYQADAVTLIDTLPPGVMFVSASSPPSAISGQTLRWNLGTIGNGGLIMVTVQSDANLADGTILINRANISTVTPGDPPGNNDGNAATMVQRADVAVSKSSPTSFPVLSGAQVVYRLDYRNDGPASAASVRLQDTPPPQLSGVTWVCDSGCTASGSGALDLSLGRLAVGATGRVTLRGTALTTLRREDFSNTATISTSTPDRDAVNNRSSVPGAVWTNDLQLTKLAAPQVLAGETFTATLRYQNAGPAAADGVTLTDSLPAGVQFISASAPPAAQSGQTLTWNLGTLGDGASGSIALLLRSSIDLPDGGTLTNRAQIAAASADRDASNDAAQASTLVRTSADLTVSKRSSATLVRSGDLVTYTLSYRSGGPSLARAVVVTDTLPSGATLVSAAPAPTAVDGAVISWALNDLAPNSGGTFTVTTRLSATAAATTLVNQVSIGSSTPGPQPGRSATAAVTVGRPDLSISKTDGLSTAEPGDLLEYQITVHNSGPITATGVVVREEPPPGVVISGGWQAVAGGYTQALAPIAAGATVTLTFALRLPQPLTVTEVLNRAAVSDDDPGDPTPDDTQTEDRDAIVVGALGDTVWNDRDGDGLLDADEPGLGGVTVELLDPDTLAVLGRSQTDAAGQYGFSGLRMGRYAVQIAPSTTQGGAYYGYRLTTAARASALLTRAAPTDLTLDFGLRLATTSDVTLAELRATRDAAGVTVFWTTAAELGTDRFEVLRSAGVPDKSRAVSIGQRRAAGPFGGDYSLRDADVPAGPVYYWLVEIQTNGVRQSYGPFAPRGTAGLGGVTYLPLLLR